MFKLFNLIRLVTCKICEISLDWSQMFVPWQKKWCLSQGRGKKNLNVEIIFFVEIIFCILLPPLTVQTFFYRSILIAIFYFCPASRHSSAACYRWGPGFKSRHGREFVNFFLNRKFNKFKFEYHYSVGLWTNWASISLSPQYLDSFLLLSLDQFPWLVKWFHHPDQIGRDQNVNDDWNINHSWWSKRCTP